tara:strand:+ start:2118 stop:2858 length:741 start_codon:yes stop_codon:yes gene_type:complete
MRLAVITIIYLFILSSHLSYAQELKVGIEPFPPLINEDGSGLVLDMLSTLTAETDLNFNFQIMTYARAKKELKSERLQLIGLTPFQLETKKFYQYGLELDWHIDTCVDFVALNDRYFDVEKLPDGSIGTLLGNAEFFAEIINVSVDKFVEVSSLEQLVKMLALGRLKVILFERASTMTAIKASGIKDIYYKNMGIVPASLAVPNTPAGLILKTKLDNLLIDLDNTAFFSEFINYTSMADSGHVINQ